jgi:Domain of unknown function (DUF4287)/Domain of unknown function (DUF5655)
MSTVDEALQTQIRNIEEKYGKSLAEWIALISDSGITKHTEIIAMLKSQYGVTHGSANRLALIAREADAASIAAKASGSDPIDDMYSGKKAGLKPLHDALMTTITAFGNDIEVAPKKGYVSRLSVNLPAGEDEVHSNLHRWVAFLPGYSWKVAFTGIPRYAL